MGRLKLCLLLPALLLLSACQSTPILPEVDPDPQPPVLEFAAAEPPVVEVPTVSGNLNIAPWSLQTALERGASVFYGEIIGRSEESFEHITSPLVRYGWLYHEIYVKVLDCYYSPEGLKAGDTFTYRELGGENWRYRFITPNGVPVAEIGDKVIILAHEDIFITYDRLIPVTDGTVTRNKNNETVQYTLEEFAAQIAALVAALPEE